MTPVLQSRYARLHHRAAAKRRARYYFERDAETLPREALVKLQLRRLRASLKNAWENVPLHRQRMKAACVKPEDIRSLDDVARLLVREGGTVSTARMQALSEQVTGQDLSSFFKSEVP